MYGIRTQGEALTLEDIGGRGGRAVGMGARGVQLAVGVGAAGLEARRDVDLAVEEGAVALADGTALLDGCQKRRERERERERVSLEKKVERLGEETEGEKRKGD